MKKLIITLLIILTAVSVSCYDSSRNATVRINLGNMPVAGNMQGTFPERLHDIIFRKAWAQAQTADDLVDKVHIAALSGGTAIAVASIDASDVSTDGTSDYVELSVPAGGDITIVVVGETADFAAYYGTPGNTLNLKAGETTTVTVTMNVIDSAWPNFNRQISVPPYYLSWDAKPGAVVTVRDGSMNVIYSGTGSRVYIPAGLTGSTFYLRAEFPFAGISTITFDYGW